MRASWKVIASACLAAFPLAACSSPGNTTGRAYEQFRFSCCAAADLDTAIHPGDTVSLHWIAQSTGTTTDAAAAPLTLTAVLSGPFASVATLKAAGPASETLTAVPLHVTDQSPGDPVSTIALPASLAAGWYNLAFGVEAGSGNRVSGATVIRVTGA